MIKFSELSKEEIERCLAPASFHKEIEFLSPSVINEKKVYIIAQYNPSQIMEASWAYNDHVLQDIMEPGHFQKCIIIGNFLNPDNHFEKLEGERLIIFEGKCIDHGGENYIAYPLLDSRKKFQNLNPAAVNDYLTRK